MTKKYFNWPVITAVLVTILLMVNINATAYDSDDLKKHKIVTSKSDRSLIKDVLINQKQMISLINEIKGACKKR